MKRFLIVLVGIFCLLATVSVYAGQCDDFATTGLESQEVGRFCVYSLHFVNRSKYEVICLVVGVLHQRALGEVIDFDFKVIRTSVRPGTFQVINFTTPIPEGAALTNVGVTDVIIDFNGVAATRKCIERNAGDDSQ